MRNLIFLLGIITVLNSCNRKKPALDAFTSENLKIEKINEHLYKHISYLDTQGSGKIACNGAVYFNGNEVIIFDTPTNDIATTELINWIGDKNIKAVIATHFHVDCIGGLKEFHSKGIKSYASNLTIELAKGNHKILPQVGFEKELEIKIGNEIVLAKYFGQGHTKDNIIGYFANENAIFGGCLIKGLGAGKGNLVDANIEDWSVTVSKIKREFPKLEIVIPGHGKHGGKELLDFTIDLFVN